MIVAGRVHFSGGRRDLALAALRRAEAMPAVATLQGEARAERDAATVTLRVSTQVDAATLRSWQARVALAERRTHTSVLHGENGGETLEEAVVVRWLSEPIAVGTDAMRVVVPKPRDLDFGACELAAFVQTGASGPVVAARALPLAVR
jgi:hypothetical protein